MSCSAKVIFMYSCFTFLLMCFVYIPFCFSFLTFLFCFYGDWDNNTMLVAVPLFLTRLPIVSVCFVPTYKWAVWLAIRPGLIFHFLHKELPVPSQEYENCFLFVCLFELLILPSDDGRSDLNFSRSSVFLYLTFCYQNSWTVTNVLYDAIYTNKNVFDLPILKIPRLQPKTMTTKVVYRCSNILNTDNK